MSEICGILENLPTRAVCPAILAAPLAGTVVPLTEVNDALFAGKILGDGIAIEPTDGRLFAPCDGVVTGIFHTGHMVTVRADSGCKILLHIGIDTVKLNGKFFRIVARTGSRIRKGDLLVRFDIRGLRSAGCRLTAPMIICNTADYSAVTPVASGIISAGRNLLSLK